MNRKPYNLYLAAMLLTLLSAAPSQLVAADVFINNALQRHVQHGKLDQRVREKVAGGKRSEVIVLLADDTGQLPAASDAASRDKLRDRLRTRARRLTEKKENLLSRISRKTTRLTPYSHFPVMHLELDEAALVEIVEQADVVSIHENRGLPPLLTQSLPLIQAPQAHERGITGNGTAVAVLDTGLNYTLGAFGSCSSPGTPSSCRVVEARDFAPDDGALDDNGHGTNVAGIVLGTAPGAGIIALDVFRADGYAYYSDMLAALDWVVQNQPVYNIVAVNMSLGGGGYSAPCPSNMLAGAIATLKGVGVLSVIASGNGALNGLISEPACIPDSISVGAVYDSNIGQLRSSVCTDPTTTADKVTCFTNIADFLSILAPGAFISAAGISMAGTSQATPHVAGAVALIKAAHPSLTANTVATRLTATGDPISNSRQGNTYITPRLNLDNALAFPQAAVTPSSTDFGIILPGAVSLSQTITVSNSGSAPLSIGAMTVTGADADQFPVQSETCSGATLPPTASCSISLYFRAPAAGGWKSASLLIASDDPDHPEKTVSLSGAGSFQLSVIRSGNGAITAPQGIIDCGSVCSVYPTPGTTISLTATPAGDSLFSGWSGSCSGNGLCTVTMSANREATATFILKPPIMLQSAPPAYYSTIGEVYAAAGEGTNIILQAQSFTGDLLFDREMAVSVTGGYNGAYSQTDGATTVVGTITISAGTVTLANLIIR